MCVCVSVCEQYADRTDTPILMRSSLNSCLSHTLEPYWNWWPWVKGQGHSDSISFFLHNSVLTSLMYISVLLCLIKMKFDMPLRYALCRFVVEFHENQMGDDVIVTKFSLYKCPYFKFYWTYKLHFWYIIKRFLWFKCKWPWQKLKVTGEGHRSQK